MLLIIKLPVTIKFGLGQARAVDYISLFSIGHIECWYWRMVGNLFCDKVCLGTIRITPVTAERLTKDRVVRFLQTLWIIIRNIVIQMIVNWWYTFWYHTQDKSDFRYSGFFIQKFGTSTMYKFTVLRDKLNFSHQPWVSCKILTNTTWLLPWFCCRHPPLLQLYIIYK